MDENLIGFKYENIHKNQWKNVLSLNKWKLIWPISSALMSDKMPSIQGKMFHFAWNETGNLN